MTKRIPIDQLRPGMYVVGFEKSWWQTPFFHHKWLVEDPTDITQLREAGVQEVIIDPQRGNDVETMAPRSTVLVSPSSAMTREDASNLQASAAPTPAPPSTTVPSSLNGVAVDIPAARAARNEALAILQGIFEGVKIGKAVDTLVLKHAVAGILDSILARPQATLILSQMQHFDSSLLTHAVDVCVLSLLLGVEQELSPQHLETLGAGALLHDIGKTRLPRNLLRKSETYSPQAQKLLDQHPRLGLAVLTSNKDIDREVLRIVLEHHERADGSGFPGGLTTSAISPLSQIVGLVNVYDDLVSGYSGRSSHLPTQALRCLYQMGKDGVFANQQVHWFIRTLGVYPIGAGVELNTKERGLVVATDSAESQKPTVLIVVDQNGRLYPTPRLVNLSRQEEEEPATTIIRPLEATAIPVCLGDYFKESA
jgi:HD-GYP domain-containing protein (c-di-GMP phosphodiesterase class II)